MPRRLTDAAACASRRDASAFSSRSGESLRLLARPRPLLLRRRDTMLRGGQGVLRGEEVGLRLLHRLQQLQTGVRRQREGGHLRRRRRDRRGGRRTGDRRGGRIRGRRDRGPADRRRRRRCGLRSRNCARWRRRKTRGDARHGDGRDHSHGDCRDNENACAELRTSLLKSASGPGIFRNGPDAHTRKRPPALRFGPNRRVSVSSGEPGSTGTSLVGSRGSPGSPSTRSPRMFFMMLVVPPSIELAWTRRNAFCGFDRSIALRGRSNV